MPHHKRDGGFTLIELMVVVLVIAVLIGIAIPMFLGFRAQAQDKAAQASLTTAEKATWLLYLDQGSVPNQATLLTLMPTIEPNIDWVDHFDESTGPNVVSMDQTGGGTQLALAALSDSGTCFYLQDTPTGASAGTTYGEDTGCLMSGASATASAW